MKRFGLSKRIKTTTNSKTVFLQKIPHHAKKMVPCARRTASRPGGKTRIWGQGVAPTYIGDETGDECPSSASGQDDDASDQGSIVEPPPLRKALRQNTKGPEATKASSKASVSVSSTRATNSKSVKAQESGSKSAASGEQRMSAVDVLKKKGIGRFMQFGVEAQRFPTKVIFGGKGSCER